MSSQISKYRLLQLNWKHWRGTEYGKANEFGRRVCRIGDKPGPGIQNDTNPDNSSKTSGLLKNRQEDTILYREEMNCRINRVLDCHLP